MSVIRGDDLILYIVEGGVQQALCYARDCTLNITHDVKEITGRKGDKWKRYIYDTASYSIDVSGLLNTDVGGSYTLQDALLNGDNIYWKMTDDISKVWSGEVLVTNATIAGPYSDAGTFSNTLLGNGKLTEGTLAGLTLTRPKLTDTMEPFLEEILFTYDGTNNVQQLRFTPVAVNITMLNSQMIDPFKDYHYSGATIVIDPNYLRSGVEYRIITSYFK